MANKARICKTISLDQTSQGSFIKNIFRDLTNLINSNNDINLSDLTESLFTQYYNEFVTSDAVKNSKLNIAEIKSIKDFKEIAENLSPEDSIEDKIIEAAINHSLFKINTALPSLSRIAGVLPGVSLEVTQAAGKITSQITQSIPGSDVTVFAARQPKINGDLTGWYDVLSAIGDNKYNAKSPVLDPNSISKVPTAESSVVLEEIQAKQTKQVDEDQELEDELNAEQPAVQVDSQISKIILGIKKALNPTESVYKMFSLNKLKDLFKSSQVSADSIVYSELDKLLLFDSALELLPGENYVNFDNFAGNSIATFYLTKDNQPTTKVVVTYSLKADAKGDDGRVVITIKTTKGSVENKQFKANPNLVNTEAAYNSLEDFVKDYEGFDISADLVKTEMSQDIQQTKKIRSAFIAARNKHLNDNGRIVMFSGTTEKEALSPFASNAQAEQIKLKNYFLKEAMELMKSEKYAGKQIDLTNLPEDYVNGGINGVSNIQFKTEIRSSNGNDYRLLIYADVADGGSGKKVQTLIGGLDPTTVGDSALLTKYYKGLKENVEAILANDDIKTKYAVHNIDVDTNRDWLPKYLNYNPKGDKVEAIGEFPIHPIYQDIQKYGTRLEDATDRGFFILDRFAEEKASAANASANEIKALQENWSDIVDKFDLSVSKQEAAGIIVRGSDSLFPTKPGKKPVMGEKNVTQDKIDTHEANYERYQKLNSFLKTPRKLSVKSWTKQMKAMGYGVSQVFVNTTDSISAQRRKFGVGGVTGNAMMFYSPFHTTADLDNYFTAANAPNLEVMYSVDKINTKQDSSFIKEEKEPLSYSATPSSYTVDGETISVMANFTRDLAKKFGINAVTLQTKPISASYLQKLIALFTGEKTLSNATVGGNAIYPYKQAFNYKQSFYTHYKLLNIIRKGDYDINNETTFDLLASLFDPSDKYYVNPELRGITETFTGGLDPTITLKERREFIHKEAAMVRAKLNIAETDTDPSKTAENLIKYSKVDENASSIIQSIFDKLMNDNLLDVTYEATDKGTVVNISLNTKAHPLLKSKESNDDNNIQLSLTSKEDVNADNLVEFLIKSDLIKVNKSMDGKFQNFAIKQTTTKSNPLTAAYPFNRGMTAEYKNYVRTEYGNYAAANGADRLRMSNELAIRLFGYDEHMLVVGDASSPNITMSKDLENSFNIVNHKKILGEMNNSFTSQQFGFVTVSKGLGAANKIQVETPSASDKVWNKHLEGGIQSNSLLNFLRTEVNTPEFASAWDAGNAPREKAGVYSNDPELGIKYNPVAGTSQAPNTIKVKPMVLVGSEFAEDLLQVAATPSYMHAILDVDQRAGNIWDGVDKSFEQISKEDDTKRSAKRTVRPKGMSERDFKKLKAAERIANNKAKNQQTEEETTNEDEKKIIDTLNGLSEKKNRLDSSLLSPITYDKSVSELRQIFQDTFGSYYSEDLLQSFTDKNNIVDGKKLLGWYKATFIGLHTINGKASEKVLQHEMFHKIVKEFLTKEERKQLFDEGLRLYTADTRKQYNKKEPNDTDIEEYLADMYEDNYSEYNSKYWSAIKKTKILDFADKILGKNNFVFRFFKSIRSTYLSLTGDTDAMTRISELLQNKVIQYDTANDDAREQKYMTKQDAGLQPEEFIELQTDLLYEFGNTSLTDADARRKSGETVLANLMAKLNADYINTSYFTTESLFNLSYSPATVITGLNEDFKKTLFNLINNREILEDFLPAWEHTSDYNAGYLEDLLQELITLKSEDTEMYSLFVESITSSGKVDENGLNRLMSISNKSNYSKLVKLVFNDIIEVEVDEGTFDEKDQDLGFDIITKDRTDISHADTVSKKVKRILHGLRYMDSKGEETVVQPRIIENTITELFQEVRKKIGSNTFMTTKDVSNLLESKIKTLETNKVKSQHYYHLKSLQDSLFSNSLIEEIKKKASYSLNQVSSLDSLDDDLLDIGERHFKSKLKNKYLSPLQIINSYNSFATINLEPTVSYKDYLQLEAGKQKEIISTLSQELLINYILPLNIERNRLAMSAMMSVYSSNISIAFASPNINSSGGTSAKIIESRDQATLSGKSSMIQKLIDTHSSKEKDRFALTREAKEIIGYGEEGNSKFTFTVNSTGDGFTLTVNPRTKDAEVKNFNFKDSKATIKDFATFVDVNIDNAVEGLSTTDISVILNGLGMNMQTTVIDGYLAKDAGHKKKRELVSTMMENLLGLHAQYWSINEGFKKVEGGKIRLNLAKLMNSKEAKGKEKALGMMAIITNDTNDVNYESIVGQYRKQELTNNSGALATSGWSPTRDRKDALNDLITRYADHIQAAKTTSANINGKTYAFNTTATPITKRLNDLTTRGVDIDAESIEGDLLREDNIAYTEAVERAKTRTKTEKKDLLSALFDEFKTKHPYTMTANYVNGLFRMGIDQGKIVGKKANGLTKSLKVSSWGIFNHVANTKTAKGKDFSKLSIREIMNTMVNSEFLQGGIQGFGSYTSLANRNMTVLLENIADRSYGIMAKTNNKVFYDYEGRDDSMFNLGDQAEYEYMNIYAGQLLYTKKIIEETLNFYGFDKYSSERAELVVELDNVNRILEEVRELENDLAIVNGLGNKHLDLFKAKLDDVNSKLDGKVLTDVEKNKLFERESNLKAAVTERLEVVNNKVLELENSVKAAKVNQALIIEENKVVETTSAIEFTLAGIIAGVPRVNTKQVTELKLSISEAPIKLNELIQTRDNNTDPAVIDIINIEIAEVTAEKDRAKKEIVRLESENVAEATKLKKLLNYNGSDLVEFITMSSNTNADLTEVKKLALQLSNNIKEVSNTTKAVNKASKALEEAVVEQGVLMQKAGQPVNMDVIYADKTAELIYEAKQLKKKKKALKAILSQDENIDFNKVALVKEYRKETMDALSAKTKRLLEAQNDMLVSSYNKGHKALVEMTNAKHLNKKRKPLGPNKNMLNDILVSSIYKNTDEYMNVQKAILVRGLVMTADELVNTEARENKGPLKTLTNFSGKNLGGQVGVNDRYNALHDSVVDSITGEDISLEDTLSDEQLERFKNKFIQYDFVFPAIIQDEESKEKKTVFMLDDEKGTVLDEEDMLELKEKGLLVQVDATTFLKKKDENVFNKGEVSHLKGRNALTNKFIDSLIERVFTGNEMGYDTAMLDMLLNQFHPAVTDFFVSHNINQSYLSEHLQGSPFQFAGNIHSSVIDRTKRNGTTGTGSNIPTFNDPNVNPTAPHSTVTALNFSRPEIELSDNVQQYFSDAFYDVYEFDIDFKKVVNAAFPNQKIDYTNSQNIAVLNSLRGSHNKIYKFQQAKDNKITEVLALENGILTKISEPKLTKPSGGSVSSVSPWDGISNYSFLFWLQLQSGYGYDEGRNVAAKALKMIIDDRNVQTNEVLAMKSLQLVLTSSSVYRANDKIKNLMRTSLEVGVLNQDYPDVKWDISKPATPGSVEKQLAAATGTRKKTLFDVYWEEGGWYPNEQGNFDKVGFSPTGIAVDKATAEVTRSELAVFNAWKENTEAENFMFLNRSNNEYIEVDQFLEETGLTDASNKEINDYLKNNPSMYSRMDGASIINYTDSLKKGGGAFNELAENDTKTNVLLTSNTDITSLGDIVQLSKKEKEDSAVTTPTQLLYNLGVMSNNYKVADRLYEFMGKLSEQQRSKITNKIDSLSNDFKTLDMYKSDRTKIKDNVIESLTTSNELLWSIPKENRLVEMINPDRTRQTIYVNSIEQLQENPTLREALSKNLVDAEYNRIAGKKFMLSVIHTNKTMGGEYDLITELAEDNFDDLTKISISNPILFSSLFSEVAAKFSKGIILKSHGKKSLQLPAEDFIDLIDYKGRIYTTPEFTKYISKVNNTNYNTATQTVKRMLETGEVSTRAPKYAYLSSIDGKDQIMHTELVGSNPLLPYYKFLKNVEINEMFDIGDTNVFATDWDNITEKKEIIENMFEEETFVNKKGKTVTVEVIKEEFANGVANSAFAKAIYQDKQEEVSNLRDQISHLKKVKGSVGKSNDFVEKLKEKLEGKIVRQQDKLTELHTELTKERGLVSDNKAEKLEALKDKIKKAKLNIRKAENKIEWMKTAKSSDVVTEEQKQMRKDLKQKSLFLDKITKEELVTYVDNFNKALFGVGSRIPNTGKNSNTFFKLVGFSEDYGNAVFTPSPWLFISGSDYDGDTLQIWQYHPKNGNKNSDTALDFARQILTDPANAAEIFSELDESMEVLSARSEIKFKNQATKLRPGDLWSWVQIHQQNAIGKLGVGAMALLGKHYAYTAQATKKLADFLLVEKAVNQMDMSTDQLQALSGYVGYALPKFLSTQKRKIKNYNADTANNVKKAVMLELDSYVKVLSTTTSIKDLIVGNDIIYKSDDNIIVANSLESLKLEAAKLGDSSTEAIKELKEIEEYILEYREYLKTISDRGVLPVETGYNTIAKKLNKFVTDYDLVVNTGAQVDQLADNLKTKHNIDDAADYLEPNNVKFFASSLAAKGLPAEIPGIITAIENKLKFKVDALIGLADEKKLSTYRGDKDSITRDIAEDMDIEDKPIRQWIESLIQSAVDNAKHMTLGASNITLDNANIQSAMTFLGIPKIVIMDILSKESILNIFKEYKLSSDIARDTGGSIVSFLERKLGPDNAKKYAPEILFGDDFNSGTTEELMAKIKDDGNLALGLVYALAKYSEDYAEIAGALQPTYALKGKQEDAEKQIKKILKAYNTKTPESLLTLITEVEEMEARGESMYMHPKIYKQIAEDSDEGNTKLVSSALVGLSFEHIREMLKSHLYFHTMKYDTHVIYNDLARKLETITNKFTDYTNSTRAYYKGGVKKGIYRSIFNSFINDSTKHQTAIKYKIEGNTLVKDGLFTLTNLKDRVAFKSYMQDLVVQLNTADIKGVNLDFIKRLKNENGILTFLESESMKASDRTLTAVRSEFASLGSSLDSNNTEMFLLKDQLFQYLMITESYGMEFSKGTFSRFLDMSTISDYNDYLSTIESDPQSFFTDKFAEIFMRDLAVTNPGLMRQDKARTRVNKETNEYEKNFNYTTATEAEIFNDDLAVLPAGAYNKKAKKTVPGNVEYAKGFFKISAVSEEVDVSAYLDEKKKLIQTNFNAEFSNEYKIIATKKEFDAAYSEYIKYYDNTEAQTAQQEAEVKKEFKVISNALNAKGLALDPDFIRIGYSETFLKSNQVRNRVITMEELYDMYTESEGNLDLLEMLNSFNETDEDTTYKLLFNPKLMVDAIIEVFESNQTIEASIDTRNDLNSLWVRLQEFNKDMNEKSKSKVKVQRLEKQEQESSDEEEVSDTVKLPPIIRYSKWIEGGGYDHRIYLSVVQDSVEEPGTEEVVYKRIYKSDIDNINVSGLQTITTTDDKGQTVEVDVKDVYFNNPSAEDSTLEAGTKRFNTDGSINVVEKEKKKKKKKKKSSEDAHKLKRSTNMSYSDKVKSKIRVKMFARLLNSTGQFTVKYMSPEEKYNKNSVGYVRDNVIYIDLNTASVKDLLHEMGHIIIPALVKSNVLDIDSMVDETLIKEAREKQTEYKSMRVDLDLDSSILEVLADKLMDQSISTSRLLLENIKLALNKLLGINISSSLVDDVLQESVGILQEKELSNKENVEVLSLLSTNNINKQSLQHTSDTTFECK